MCFKDCQIFHMKSNRQKISQRFGQHLLNPSNFNWLGQEYFSCQFKYWDIILPAEFLSRTEPPPGMFLQMFYKCSGRQQAPSPNRAAQTLVSRVWYRPGHRPPIFWGSKYAFIFFFDEVPLFGEIKVSFKRQIKFGVTERVFFQACYIVVNNNQ